MSKTLHLPGGDKEIVTSEEEKAQLSAAEERELQFKGLIDRPELVGATSLSPVGSALPRQNLKEPGVATAVGTDLEGRPIVVTSSIGVDLDLVPSAADDRCTHAPGARLVLAVPQRDALAVTTELARHLVDPAEVVAVPDEWPALSSERSA